MRPSSYYEAISTLTGCVIGAGVLGIPYVVVRAGFWTGFLVIIVLGLVTLLIHLMTGEIALRSHECHQLVGYASKYLGKKGKYAMTLAMIIGIYGALIAYTIGISQILVALFGGSQLLWAGISYAVLGLTIYGTIRSLGKSELVLEFIKLAAFLAVIAILVASRNFSADRLTGFSWDSLLIPYGVVLFAYVGTAAIPEVREQTKMCPIYTRRAIVIGSAIPIVCYALFAAAVVGVSGAFTTEVATVGLSNLIGTLGFVLMQVFAIAAMASSFVALGFALKAMYVEDFNLPHAEGFALTVGIPLALMALGAHSFVNTLELTGVFAGGLTGVLIVLMHARAKNVKGRKPEYHIPLNKLCYGALIVLFAIGMLYELVLVL